MPLPVTYYDEVIADSPDSYLRCDDSGGSVIDEGSQGFGGWTASLGSYFEASLIRDGVSAWGPFPNDSVYTFDLFGGGGGAGDYTVEGWFRFDASPEDMGNSVGLWTMGSFDNAYLKIDPDAGSGHDWSFGSNAESVNFGPISVNVFDFAPHHIVLAYSSSLGTVDLWVDGTLRASGSIGTYGFESFNGTYWCTAYFGSYSMQGAIDELAVYTYYVDSSRIIAHWDAGKATSGTVVDKTGGASAVAKTGGTKSVARSMVKTGGAAISQARAGGAKVGYASKTGGGAASQARAGGPKSVSTALTVDKTGGGIIGAAVVSYVAQVRADAPTAYYQMVANSLTQPEDQGGPSLILNGATPNVTGATTALGPAVSFDGVNDYGRVSGLDLSATDKLTVEYWLLWDAYNNDDDLSMEFGESNQNTGFAHDPSSSNVGSLRGWAAFMNNGGAFMENQMGRPPVAEWHHIVVVFDRNTVSDLDQIIFYLDGALATKFATAGQNNMPGNFGNLPLMVMARSAASDGVKSLFGAGDMQHLALYSSVLSASRIADHYNARSSTGSGVGAAAGGAKSVARSGTGGGIASQAGAGGAKAVVLPGVTIPVVTIGMFDPDLRPEMWH